MKIKNNKKRKLSEVEEGEENDNAEVEETSWDELSSHQAEADSLNLASSYGYITTQF